jgi:molybdate transport system permease protein
MANGTTRAGKRRLVPVPLLGGSVLLLFLAFPLFTLSWRAVEHASDLNERSQTAIRDALVLSAFTSLTSLLIIVGFGTPLAYALARHEFRGKVVVSTLVELPIVLPPAVSGIALLLVFGRRGTVGSWLDDVGIRVGFTTAAVVLTEVFVASPFYLRTARVAFAQIDAAVEEAASVLGASPFAVLRRVTLPIAAPGIAAGAVLAWARAVGEFGATIIFAGNLPRETQTVPLAIYSRYESGDLNAAIVMAVILLFSSFLVLVSVRGIGGRLRYGVSDG